MAVKWILVPYLSPALFGSIQQNKGLISPAIVRALSEKSAATFAF